MRLFLLLLLFAAPVFAQDKPPPVLVEHIEALEEHMPLEEKTCRGTRIPSVPCRIFLDHERFIVYFYLYDRWGTITHILALGDDKREIALWVRVDQSV